MKASHVSVVVLAGLLMAGCATTLTDGPRRQYNVLTAEEIQSVRASNLYEVIDRLRPRWLSVRSQQSFTTPTSVVVYQGQTLLGGTEMLRQMGSDEAREIRYLDGPTASATLPGLGTRQVEGAIVVNPLD